MKELKLYVCEGCGKQHHDKQKAISCEKGHFVIKGVSAPIYNPTDSKKEYPESVLVEFTNGQSARYTRKGN